MFGELLYLRTTTMKRIFTNSVKKYRSSLTFCNRPENSHSRNEQTKFVHSNVFEEEGFAPFIR